MSVGPAQEPQGPQQPGSSPAAAGINQDHELSFLAERTAGDHGIKFSIGEPGGGSFANTERREITLDPKHCGTRAEQRGVAAHEGRHILITPSLSQMGYNRQQAEDFARKVGTLSGRNLIEDFAVNDSIVRDFPALEGDILSLYTNRLPSDPAMPIVHPEIDRIVGTLGFVPRFAVALGGLLQDWVALRHSKGFGASPQECLAEPFLGGTSDDPDLRNFFQRNYLEARHAASKVAPPGATGQELLDFAGARFAIFNNSVYPDLEKLFEKDIEQLAKAISQAMAQEQQRQKGESSGSPGQNGQEQGEGRDSGTGDGADAGSSPVPGKGLSAEARRQARERLSGLEDAIRRALKGLLGAEDAPSSVEATKKETSGERTAEAAEARAREEKRLGDQIRKTVDANLSDFHCERRKIVALIDLAYNELCGKFDPHSHYDWDRGLPEGSHVDARQVVQFEATGLGIERLYRSRISPRKPDLALAILVDTSGSMSASDRHVLARCAVIFARELFQKLDIQTCCIAFNERPSEFISFGDDLSDQSVQEDLMRACSAPGGSTNDSHALLLAEERLQTAGTRDMGIIMISDAGSSQGDELRKTVERLERAGMPVIHFGLGHGTADAAQLYARSFGDLELAGEGDQDFLTVFCREMKRIAEESFGGSWEE